MYNLAVTDTLGENSDHPQWWENREFEHRAEALAIVKLLEQVARRKSIVDIGAGFGRLTPIYSPFFSKLILIDPANDLLAIARSYLGNTRGIEFKLGRAEKLPLPDTEFDVALCVHLLDHFTDPKDVFLEANRVLKSEGFLIVEFSGKNHSIKNVMSLLRNADFLPVEILSVSNLGHRFAKRFLPLSFLLFLEGKFQRFLKRFYLGSSIFILAQKAEREEKDRLLKTLEL